MAGLNDRKRSKQETPKSQTKTRLREGVQNKAIDNYFFFWFTPNAAVMKMFGPNSEFPVETAPAPLLQEK